MKIGIPFKVIGLRFIDIDRKEVDVPLVFLDKITEKPKMYVFRSREEKENWKRCLGENLCTKCFKGKFRELRGVKISYLGGTEDLI